MVFNWECLFLDNLDFVDLYFLSADLVPVVPNLRFFSSIALRISVRCLGCSVNLCSILLPQHSAPGTKPTLGASCREDWRLSFYVGVGKSNADDF
jgi:hypothetical protein